jgi:pimeloyl-ACP methyl ester carboxylesterase
VRLFASRSGPALCSLAPLVPMPLRKVALYQVYAHPSRARRGTIECYSRALLRRPVIESVLRVLRCWNADFGRLAVDIANIRCPVLLVWGEKDYVVPVRTALELQQHLKCAQLSIIPDCGHLPYEELPKEFNQRVLKWLLLPAQELC